MVPPPRHKNARRPCRACPEAMSGRQFSGFARWVNQRPCPAPSAPEAASKRQFSALSMGKLAPCPRLISPELAAKRSFSALHNASVCPLLHSVSPGTGVRAAISPPAAWAVTRTARYTLSGTLSCEILPFFPALSLSCVKNARCILSKNSPVCPVLLHQL